MFKPTLSQSLERTLAQKLVSIGGLTFFKNYVRSPGSSLDDDFALGSKVSTFTASRSATAPATYIDSNGVVQLVTTSDIPRYAGGYYDATGFHAQRGLMIEAAGTNLLAYSNDMSQWTTGGCTFSTDGTLAPDGSQASKVIAAVGGYINKSSNSTTAGYYTFSLYLKGTVTYLVLGMQKQGGDWSMYTSGSSLSLSATKWRRFTLTTNKPDDGLKLQVVIQSLEAGDVLYAWGAQCEFSPYATSFIPTTTAALTRNAEVLKYAIANNRTNAAETIFIKYANSWAATAPTTALHLLDSDADKVSVAFIAASDSYSYYPNATDDAATTVTDTTDPAINTSYVLAAVSYGATVGTNAEIYSNGVSKATSTTNYTEPVMGTNFFVGSRNDATLQVNGLIQKVAIFNRALSAAEVLNVTNLLNVS